MVLEIGIITTQGKKVLPEGGMGLNQQTEEQQTTLQKKLVERHTTKLQEK